MNAKTENALALENRPEGSLHAPMRIVPYGYGRRDDDDDDIDDLGSSEAPPPWAPSALAQVRGARARPTTTISVCLQSSRATISPGTR